MPRKRISRPLERKILVDFRHQCAVCLGDDITIHHIDKCNSNDDEDNLILLCLKCHGKAHTKSDLSKDLTPAHLKEYRKRAMEERNVLVGIPKIIREQDTMMAEIAKLSGLVFNHIKKDSEETNND
jgi:hypothetical protein